MRVNKIIKFPSFVHSDFVVYSDIVHKIAKEYSYDVICGKITYADGEKIDWCSVYGIPNFRITKYGMWYPGQGKIEHMTPSDMCSNKDEVIRIIEQTVKNNIRIKDYDG